MWLKHFSAMSKLQKNRKVFLKFMKNRDEIVRSWYPNETLSDDEVKVIYDNLLNLFLIFYQESRNINSEMKGEKNAHSEK